MNEAPCCNVPVCNYIVGRHLQPASHPWRTRLGRHHPLIGPKIARNASSEKRSLGFHDFTTKGGVRATPCHQPIALGPKSMPQCCGPPTLRSFDGGVVPDRAPLQAAAGDAARSFAGPYHFFSRNTRQPASHRPHPGTHLSPSFRVCPIGFDSPVSELRPRRLRFVETSRLLCESCCRVDCG